MGILVVISRHLLLGFAGNSGARLPFFFKITFKYTIYLSNDDKQKIVLRKQLSLQTSGNELGGFATDGACLTYR